MKTKTVALFAALLLVSMLCGGCNRTIRHTFTLSIKVLENQALDAGMIEGSGGKDSLQFEIGMCDLPSLQGIRDMIHETAPQFIANRIRITSIELVDGTLTTDNGDFGFVDSVEVYYIPKGAEDDEAELLGSAEGSFEDTLTFVGNPGVNFLALLEENDANTGEGCPTIRTNYEGTLPEDPLTFDLTITADVTISVRLM